MTEIAGIGPDTVFIDSRLSRNHTFIPIVSIRIYGKISCSCLASEFAEVRYISSKSFFNTRSLYGNP